ncbi:MAG: hypothetical protein JWQ89_802 [Devosia sp.]|uniref:hypothetical protein n=1 Tax=Devosia sp. TaxID=1871048 RepID=UPI0026399C98|nr:hypothetical protein [Devosia sp.]MDB5539075.1 hypothetical protein [Devosia sp.]
MITTVKDRVAPNLRETSDLEAERGIFGRLLLFIAKRRADTLLRRALRPRPIGRAASLPPHLLKDIGLPPDFRG